MVPGLVGEGYANFGYVGVAVSGALVAWLYLYAYRKTQKGEHLTASRMFYLMLLTAAILVYRDGLCSLVNFPLAVGMPIALTALGIYVRQRLTLHGRIGTGPSGEAGFRSFRAVGQGRGPANSRQPNWRNAGS